MTIVNLTPAEMMQAIVVGAMRRLKDLKRCRDRYGTLGNPWDADIEGAMAEMAVAKVVGAFWSIGEIGHPDAGKLQVRSTRRDDGRLILHREDPDKDVFVLVCGGDGHYRLAGHIEGAAGKKDAYWADPKTGRPCFWVPQADLNSIQSLLRNEENL